MIVGGLLVRNEADRYLIRALQNASLFCDELVILDDGSTDATPTLAAEYGTVHTSTSDGFWGQNESRPRARLWDLCADRAGPEGWIYIFDADHELIGLTPTEFRALCKAEYATAWAFPLWDCWDSDTQMRSDGYWQAHNNPRPWLFSMRGAPQDPLWPERDIHSGHAPQNFQYRLGYAPEGCGIRHLGYVKREDRLAKCEKYLALAPERYTV